MPRWAAADFGLQSCSMGQLSVHPCWISMVLQYLHNLRKLPSDDAAGRAGPFSWAACSCFASFYKASLRKAVRRCLHLMKHWKAHTLHAVQRCRNVPPVVVLWCYVVHKGTTISPLVSKPDDSDKVSRWGLNWRWEEEREMRIEQALGGGELKVERMRQNKGREKKNWRAKEKWVDLGEKI